jgi:Dna[CI] antecedent, DciA
MQSIPHTMQPVAPSLEKVVARSLRKSTGGQGPVLAWPLACGSAVAARTRALEFSVGILRVQVADLGWRRELQALAPRYVAVLNRYLTEKVTRIEFVVAEPKSPVR